MFQAWGGWGWTNAVGWRGADLLQPLAHGTRVEHAEVQHGNATVMRDADAHPGAAARQTVPSPAGHGVDRRVGVHREDADVPGVELPGRGRAAVPCGVQIGSDGEAAAGAVGAERAAFRAGVPAISGPGQEQRAGAGRGTGGEGGVGPGGAAGVKVPSTAREPCGSCLRARTAGWRAIRCRHRRAAS